MNELKPCPFCGGENVSLVYWDEAEQNTKAWERCDDDSGATFPMVECRDCESTVIFAGLGYGKEVIRAYNKRSVESGSIL